MWRRPRLQGVLGPVNDYAPNALTLTPFDQLERYLLPLSSQGPMADGWTNSPKA